MREKAKLTEKKAKKPQTEATPKKEEPKKAPAKAPQLESTPIKYWKQDDEEDLGKVVVADKDGERDYMETLKSVIGVKDKELACNILSEGIAALQPTCGRNETDAYNVALQALHDLQPKDAVEARLAVQASALFSHGMSNLRKAATTDMLCHADHYSNRAIKLLRLHNETIEALNRHRRGGVQQVIVQHQNNFVAGHAVVNNINGVGGIPQNQGSKPCSENAEPEQEPMEIGHVDSPPWLTEGVASTGDFAQEQRPKRARSAREKLL